LVDGPQKITGIHRQVIATKRLSLTDLVAKIPRNSREKAIKAAWESQNILAAWEATSWAKKMATKKVRANLSDFDRFKVMIAKKQKSKIVAEKVAELSA
jgi:large subunit ribosomal protein L14e